MLTNEITSLHVIASLHPRCGGPSRTVVQLTDALASQTVNVKLLTQGMRGKPSIASGNLAVQRMNTESSSANSLRLGLPVQQALKNLMRRDSPHLIHSHGLWLPVNHWASLYARRFGVPLVVHPRGTLEPWALHHKAIKKRLGMALFQRRDLQTAQLFVATSENEYHSIRNLGLTQPVAIVPNGIEFNSAGTVTNRSQGFSRKRTALFLSRVHPVKGLLNLIEAWRLVQPLNWQLIIAGPNEGRHLDEVLHAARQSGIEAQVEYIGEVYGLQKTVAYRNADFFILPTFSENFGVVVAEALSHGLPVITTRGAPWADLEKYDCGWWVDIGVKPLVAALHQAMALSDEERCKMGARGRKYVERYNWDYIAGQIADVYRWLLKKGPRPDCVILD